MTTARALRQAKARIRAATTPSQGQTTLRVFLARAFRVLVVLLILGWIVGLVVLARGWILPAAERANAPDNISPNPRALIAIKVAGVQLQVKEGYLRTPIPQDDITNALELHAVLPRLEPRTINNWRTFADAGADLTRITIAPRNLPGNPETRFRILHNVGPVLETEAPEGLKAYALAKRDAVYPLILFLNDEKDGKFVGFACSTPHPDALRSPSCTGVIAMEHNLALTYRFRRDALNQWRALHRRMTAFAHSLTKPAQQAPRIAPAQTSG